MPRVSKLRPPPINWGQETIGQGLARIRKKHGFTQVELAVKIGILKPHRKVPRRLEQMEALPPTQQLTLPRTIDTFLEVAAWKTARHA
jgi:transcriptional regulator with XRE-family HTH domain